MEEQNKDTKILKLVPITERQIQIDRRIAIPDTLLQNLNVGEGDVVKLYLGLEEETGEKAIVIKKPKNPRSKKTRGRKRGDNYGTQTT